MIIRPAKVTDTKEIHKIIEYYVNNKRMLRRSFSTLYEDIQEFVVFENRGKIIACGALHVLWEDLAEIKSLAVLDEYQRQGVGRKIVTSLQENAKNLGVNKVFVLSFDSEFFVKLGYKKIRKEDLPLKIWRECIDCHLFQGCGKIALALSLIAE
ncbi:MAG: N-acetyltransferase [Endomicrobium sp.]|jgi:amino-acid N-acetyltransferase|nr:N-acetyltransferase [Endomicrobium sp.]